MSHRWNGKTKGSSDECKGGLVVACIKCGCIKEIVKGLPTYFIDDTVYPIAPKCDERLIAGSKNKPQTNNTENAK